VISKATRGKGFSGCISYISEKSSEVRTINIASGNWKNAASEMRAVANTNATSKCVYHHWLSFSPDERLSDEQMFSAAESMIQKLGLSDHQHVMAIHRDREHHHIHVVSNLISFDGKAEKLSHDFRSRPVFAREIENEMGLKKFQKSSRVENAKSHSDNVFTASRIDKIHNTLSSSHSFVEFQKSLLQIGISIDEKSSRLNSINYRVIDVESGIYIAGSKVDAVLTSPSSLSKKFTPDDRKTESASSTFDPEKIAQINLALKNSSSWEQAQMRLLQHRIEIQIVKSGARVRGFRLLDHETGRSVKASEVGFSYVDLEKRFSSQPKKQPSPISTPSPENQKEVVMNMKPSVKPQKPSKPKPKPKTSKSDSWNQLSSHEKWRIRAYKLAKADPRIARWRETKKETINELFDDYKERRSQINKLHFNPCEPSFSDLVLMLFTGYKTFREYELAKEQRALQEVKSKLDICEIKYVQGIYKEYLPFPESKNISSVSAAQSSHKFASSVINSRSKHNYHQKITLGILKQPTQQQTRQPYHQESQHVSAPAPTQSTRSSRGGRDDR
jgi:Relaxase/Mobilisation nuclease domain